MTTPYDARTVEACIEAIKKMRPDDCDPHTQQCSDDATDALRALPVAGWTREPSADGYYVLNERGWNDTPHIRRTYLAMVSGIDEDLSRARVDPLLPPPPQGEKEGE